LSRCRTAASPQLDGENAGRFLVALQLGFEQRKHPRYVASAPVLSSLSLDCSLRTVTAALAYVGYVGIGRSGSDRATPIRDKSGIVWRTLVSFLDFCAVRRRARRPRLTFLARAATIAGRMEDTPTRVYRTTKIGGKMISQVEMLATSDAVAVSWRIRIATSVVATTTRDIRYSMGDFSLPDRSDRNLRQIRALSYSDDSRVRGANPSIALAQASAPRLDR